MPGLVRKLVLFAAADGLILQPVAQRNQRPAAAVRIDYEKHDLKPFSTGIPAQNVVTQAGSLEVAGVIGVLEIASSAYLISITKRTEVARVWGKPVYVISGVAIIPLSSQVEAQRALQRSRLETSAAEKGSDEARSYGEEDSSDTDDEAWVEEPRSIDDHPAPELMEPNSDEAGNSLSGERQRPGIAEEVFSNSSKRAYGRFTDRWFSRRGWTMGQLRIQSASSISEQVKEGSADDALKTSKEDANAAGTDDETTFERWPQSPGLEKPYQESFIGTSDESLAKSLLPKVMRTTKLLLNSNTFCFSYDLDITRRFSDYQPPSAVPLHRQVDPEYFWNANLTIPFLEAGLHEYALPIMQGFVGQRIFSLQARTVDSTAAKSSEDSYKPPELARCGVEGATPEAPLNTSDLRGDGDRQEFLMTLISRRSTKRAGLRYLRRGIDEDGNVANAVETEQILSSPSWDPDSKIHSFVQTRGSIPLFYSQMPYTFKPPPKLHAGNEASEAALKKHFSALAAQYGEVQAISLLDRHGGEVEVGEAYEKTVRAVNSVRSNETKPIRFTWFEFHAVCKGMKFENVSVLVDQMAPFLNSSSFTTLQASQPTHMQTGIIRSNCMDCLDRTNVVQSALAQYILSQQLEASGFSIDLASDPSTIWFNTLWADNGDAISRAYTGTSALKGDYTRTRKRNTLGALTDLSLTLTRYYHNLFDDFFTQAVIDYLLGHVNEGVFAEFESTMTTADPAMDLRKARQSAIDAAVHVVVEEDEDLLQGWALLVPAIPNTLRSFPFAEALLLLTEKAIYNVEFDWDASKVSSFERIELSQITNLQYGAYITETHTNSQMDPARNAGLVIRYRPRQSRENMSGSSIRVNTRSLENSIRDAWSITGADGHEDPSVSDHVDEESTAPLFSAAQDEVEDRRKTLFLAFKALPERSPFVKPGSKGRQAKGLQEVDVVRQVCEELRNSINRLDKDLGGKVEVVVVEKKDVLSLNEAKKSTGYVESLAWSLKKAIWG